MGNDGGGEVLTFSQKFFTDVETDQFRSRLPMTLDGFVSHIERTANATRDTLREYWITSAAAKLRLFLATMREEAKQLDGLMDEAAYQDHTA